MRNFWLSWHGEHGAFTLTWPWWISGERADGVQTICAAVQAEDEEAACEIVMAAHDERPRLDIEFRFVEPRPDAWSPYHSNRFPRATWMPDWPMPGVKADA